MIRVIILSIFFALVATPGATWAEDILNPGVYTEEQAARGGEAFVQKCAACHGADLRGAGEVPALAGGVFLSGWSGQTLEILFDRIHDTMPQEAPASLSRQQYADILAFILKANGYPAGPRELSERSETLGAVSLLPPTNTGNEK